LESLFTNANEECNAQLLKYEADIGVYEEAIQMLRNQVEALQELADSESNNCIQLAKDMELQIEKAKEVTREQTQEELRITMKEELKETIVNELRLDELIHLIEQKTSPDKSVAQPIECIKESATPEIDAAQSIDYIQEYVETKKSVDAKEIDIKKEVECDMFSTKDGHDFEPPSTPDLARDLGRDLDVLLSSIEAQLDVEK
jgi:type IV secretory pathway VirJ component